VLEALRKAYAARYGAPAAEPDAGEGDDAGVTE
jgi:hypothetical protein